MTSRAPRGRALSAPSSESLIFDHVNLSGERFARRKVQQVVGVGATLVDCHFDRVQADKASFGAGLETSRYINCVFDGLRVRSSIGGYARFERCQFIDVDIRGWFTFAVEMVDCTVTGRIQKCVFNGTVPGDERQVAGRERNEFAGNDFRGADLRDVDFRTGIDLTKQKQKLPSGDGYLFVPNAVQAVQRARVAAMRADPGSRRQDALSLISLLEESVVDGQQQLFLRADTYHPFPAEVVADVFSALRSSSGSGAAAHP